MLAAVSACMLFSAPALLAAGSGDAAKASAKPAVSEDAQMLFWNSIKDSKDPAEFQAYLDQFPNGIFVKLAEIKLAKLQKSPTASSRLPAQAASVSAVANPRLPAQTAVAVPTSSAPKLNYRLSYRGARTQTFTLKFDGERWVTNDPIERYNCLLGPIAETASAPAVWDVQRLLNEAAAGVNIPRKIRASASRGDDALSRYALKKVDQDGARVRMLIEGELAPVGRLSGGSEAFRFSLDVNVDAARGVLTSAKTWITTTSGGRFNCEISLAE
ncbi:hypothetical protein GCM10007350_09900 [Jeongeupia chitinilytica]|uniref:Uncharacterized protein n=2 Tax=Jeongeupia chitinilytica TaxID=1041641 RepID=A0ABQ3GX16_9NEIS|nr:hypothetical protein GCM10007350_09900 [Jeongeupia chitinilytica]